MTQEHEHEDPQTGEMVEGTAALARRQGGAMQRDDGAGRDLALASESAAYAMAERARAEIQARHAVARARPRDLVRVQEAVLARCRNPRFADAAVYARPVGRKFNKQTNQWEEQYAEGLSIRFVEAAFQAMGNCSVVIQTISDSPTTRTIEVKAIDYETNADWSDQVTVPRTVEKSNPKGRKVIARRENSQGRPTFLVEATDDEMAVKVAAIKSKTARTCAERLIPPEIKEAAREVIEATLLAEEKKDPDGRLARMVELWAKLGVARVDLEAWLGRPLDQAPAKMLRDLGPIGNAIRDGEMTWAEAIEASPYRVKPEAVADGAAPAGSITEKAKAVAAKSKAKPAAEAPKETAPKEAPPPAAAETEPAKPAERQPGED